MCSCSGNMAGLTRAELQEYEYGRSSFFMCISAVFLLLVCRVNAQTEDTHVLTVADANWTLILQGEWMIKLWVCVCVWSLQDSSVNHWDAVIRSSARFYDALICRAATVYQFILLQCVEIITITMFVMQWSTCWAATGSVYKLCCNTINVNKRKSSCYALSIYKY